MGNRHHVTLYGRNEQTLWPKRQELTDTEEAVVARYRIADIDVGKLDYFDARSLKMLMSRKTVGVFSGARLVGVIRHRFPGDETVAYTLLGERRPVLFGATGEGLSDYSMSVLALHAMLTKFEQGDDEACVAAPSKTKEEINGA